MCRGYLGLFLVSLGVGCAQFAQRPDTPAAKFTVEQLECPPAPPTERYYLLVFGSQSTPIRPKYSHTWATVVRVVETGPECASLIETHTISWMPQSLEIRPLSFCVEPGVNLEMHHTIQEMLNNDEKIAVWGPFEIRAGLYRKFVMQQSFLESGTVGYQCIDSVGEAGHCGNGTDCIHAITDIDTSLERGGYPLSQFGERASKHIVDQLARCCGFINQCQTHDWLICALNLKQYPIDHRCYHGPSSFMSAMAEHKQACRD
ncbi:MAG: hypothetical protein ACJ8C4_06500 [Gemmataceae bacterium]